MGVMAAAALGVSCTFELPPLVTDGEGGNSTTTGTGAPGGSGGTGGTGGGGLADPPCTPPAPPGACSPGVDVAPRVVATLGSTPATADRPHIAWGGAVFGAYPRADFREGAGLNQFFTFGRDGSPLSGMVGPFAHSGNDDAFLGTVASHFALVVRDEGTGAARVTRFDSCGQQLGAIAVSDPAQLEQPIAVGGSDDRWLVVGIVGDLFAAVLADAPGTTALTTTGLDSSCCGSRRYAACHAFGRFHLVTYDRTVSAMQHLTIESDGTFGSARELAGVGGYPRFVGAFDSSLVLATTTDVAVFNPDTGSVDALSDRDNGTCAFATNGSKVVRVCRLDPDPAPAYITFGELDPYTGVPTELHQLIADEAVGSPSVAWDGYGWGVTWYEETAVAYAHVCES